MKALIMVLYELKTFFSNIIYLSYFFVDAVVYSFDNTYQRSQQILYQNVIFICFFYVVLSLQSSSKFPCNGELEIVLHIKKQTETDCIMRTSGHPFAFMEMHLFWYVEIFPLNLRLLSTAFSGLICLIRELNGKWWERRRRRPLDCWNMGKCMKAGTSDREEVKGI